MLIVTSEGNACSSSFLLQWNNKGFQKGCLQEVAKNYNYHYFLATHPNQFIAGNEDGLKL